MDGMVRWQVHFSGRVQGVGFRYTVVSLAARFAVAGYVKNLPDGRVLVVAEGEAREVEGLIQAVRRRMEGYIQACQIEKGVASGEFGEAGSFEVRYG